MPRSKSFDVDEVLERAVGLFWVNGFAATSMEDLVQHLGINRGSLYATFGSKEELYRRAVDRYLDANVSQLRAQLTEEGASLRQRLRSVLLMAGEPGDHRGCLLVNTATERNATSSDCRAHSSQAMEHIRAMLIEVFAASADELRPEVTPATAAETFFVCLQGLQVIGTTTTALDIDAIVDLTLGSLVGPTPSLAT
jgi:TetR/AcrR family transcriptional repressor of nem operon